MPFGAIAQGLAAGAGGFAQGYGDLWQRRQRERELGLAETEAAGLQDYRDSQIGLAKAGAARSAKEFDLTQQQRGDEFAWQKAYQGGALAIDTKNAETTATREERLSRPPVVEPGALRRERALDVLNSITAQRSDEMSDWDLDLYMRRQGFPGGLQEAVAVAEGRTPTTSTTAGPSYAGSKSLETFPGETGYGRLMRLRGNYGQPISELSRNASFVAPEVQTAEQEDLYEQIRRVRGGR